MTKEEFQIQLNRLTKTFGNTAYNEERISLLWLEMHSVTEDGFKKMIDEFIGDFRQAPLLKDFREAASRLRESAYEKQKHKNRQDSRDFFECRYTPEDKKWIVETIRKRINNECSDSDYAEFLQVLRNAERASLPRQNQQASSYVARTGE